MIISTLQLIIDFGLVVLIFLVQLCIYPAFKYYKTDDLMRWHRIYTPNITYVVFPLMMGQIILSVFYVYTNNSFLTWMHLSLVLLTWICTFLYFVPLHQKINKNNFTLFDLKKLEKGNWIRLIIWTLVFLVSIIKTTPFL